MRTTIWEYLIPSPEKKEELWNRCTFVFDTNVLLNLYRYTANTRDTLLAALDDLKDRVWLPHQVAYEYAKNRFDVIYETIEKYKKLEQLENSLNTRFSDLVWMPTTPEEFCDMLREFAGINPETDEHHPAKLTVAPPAKP